METVFVTGGTGFLGQSLISQLIRKGDRIKILVRPASQSKINNPLIEKIIGDIRDKKTFESALSGVDKIYHLAGVVTDWAPRSLYESVHIQGTKNILEAAIANKVKKLIHISTVDVLDYEHSPCVNETTGYTLSNAPYRHTKVQAEKLILNSKTDGLNFVIIRPSWIYGQGDTTFFPEIAYQIKKGQMIFIGSPKNLVPLVYSDNLSSVIIKAGEIQCADREIFLVSDGEITWEKLVEYISAGVEIKEKQFLACVPYAIAYFLAIIMEGMAKTMKNKKRPLLTRFAVEITGKSIKVNTEKAKKMLGYLPSIPLEDGIKKSVQWLKDKSIDDLRKKVIF